MKSFESNKKVWEKIYKSGNKLEYPNEILVRAVNYYFKDKNKKLLDLGCGSGNNLIHLAKSGFDCYGCDISPYAIKVCQLRAKENKINVKMDLFKNGLPYKDNFFDIVVSWQTLCYNSEESLLLMMNEISRVLKSKGKLLVTFLRKNDVIFNSSKKIGNITYVVNNSLPSQKGAVICVPLKKKDFAKVFRNFIIIDKGYFESKIADIISSHSITFGERK